MTKYILQRILYILIVFFVLSFLIFMIYNLLPTDKAAEKAREEVSADRNVDYAERYAYWQQRLGLNGTKLERYLRWLGVYPFSDGRFDGLLQGNLGTSVKYARPVSEVLTAPMKNTVILNLLVTLLSLGITIPLGIFCAVRRGSRRDTAVQVFTVIGYSLPTFMIAILFIWLFSVKLSWFPVSGMQSAGSLTWSASRRLWDGLWHLTLPLSVMVFCSLGGMTRYVRAAMTDALSLDCIRTARAKGLGERQVVGVHAWRNALIPIVTLVIGWFLGIFSGSLMIENIFAINGIGKVYFDALSGGDNEVVLALQMFYILVSLAGNLLIDLSYGLIDPRVRVQR
jgi:peptide/nickel transport system permease protein